MLLKNEASVKPNTKRIEFDTNASYTVGNMTMVVERVFRPEGAETVNTILAKLIKADVETSFLNFKEKDD